jgi:hypothetical protein
MTATQQIASWYPDPTGRFAQRYWDGSGWTDHVATAAGVVEADRVEDVAAAALSGESFRRIATGLASGAAGVTAMAAALPWVRTTGLVSVSSQLEAGGVLIVLALAAVLGVAALAAGSAGHGHDGLLVASEVIAWVGSLASGAFALLLLLAIADQQQSALVNVQPAAGPFVAAFGSLLGLAGAAVIGCARRSGAADAGSSSASAR